MAIGRRRRARIRPGRCGSLGRDADDRHGLRVDEERFGRSPRGCLRSRAGTPSSREPPRDAAVRPVVGRVEQASGGGRESEEVKVVSRDDLRVGDARRLPVAQGHPGGEARQHSGDRRRLIPQVRVHRVGERGREARVLMTRAPVRPGPIEHHERGRVWTGSLRSATWSRIENIAVFAPIPKASVRIAAAMLKPGTLAKRAQRIAEVLQHGHSCRSKAHRSSCINSAPQRRRRIHPGGAPRREPAGDGGDQEEQGRDGGVRRRDRPAPTPKRRLERRRREGEAPPGPGRESEPGESRGFAPRTPRTMSAGAAPSANADADLARRAEHRLGDEAVDGPREEEGDPGEKPKKRRAEALSARRSGRSAARGS